MRLLVRTVVIVALTLFILRLRTVDSTMALVLGGIGFAGVIIWIAEG